MDNSKSSRQYDIALEKEKARVAKLRLDIAALKQSPVKDLLEDQVTVVEAQLQEGNLEYSKQFRHETRSTILSIKLKQIFGSRDESTNIRTLLLGLVCYGIIVFFIGICAIIVFVYQTDPQSNLITFLRSIGVLPIFATVSSFGITAEAFLWGILGGAGAVSNMVRRFDKIGGKKSSFWLLFAQGLFGPIVGSLSAVVAVTFVQEGLLDILKPIPLPVIAFFAGFSEQLIDRLGETVISTKPVDQEK